MEGLEQSVNETYLIDSLDRGILPKRILSDDERAALRWSLSKYTFRAPTESPIDGTARSMHT